MVALFDEQAWKYNVYPLYDDMISRIGKQQDRLFKGRTEFTYYAPGAVRIAEKASPPIKGRSHTIETTVTLDGSEEGVLVACGGFTGGYTLFVQDGKLKYAYNFLDGVYYELESPPLPKGEVTLGFHFEHAGDFAGKGTLFVDGAAVDTVDMPRTHSATFSLSESFDVGIDHGTQVSSAYQGHFPFTGELDKIIVKLVD
jgi:arylsulfatase